MAPRPAIALLPDAVVAQLNARLVDQAFSDYEGLTAWLQEQGYQISKTAVWRHGSNLQAAMEKSLSRARERMEIAKALRGASDDEKAALMEANEMVAMDQIMDMFEEVSGLEIGERMAAIPKLVRAIADLNRSAIGSAKWKREFEAEIRKRSREEAAEELATELKNDGISVELEASIKRILTGRQ
ncbi:MAG: DUF3486 family protein [Methylobacter sp.]|jgi:hypothetical protein|uniref:phage protein Gp27 family protein n=1 Tax=Methylobacter sp. TaxID=2051955 RepID=UPI0025ED25B5|nr:phage protein Gp27 family protein [Methylobacter sp.]MCK9622973.1 DUF3486 family protein [Methylobacter sp.]